MTEDQGSSPGLALPHDAFVEEFRRWRDVRGLSKTALAEAMGYSRSYVSKVESGHERASREFAKAADVALGAGGALRRAWRGYEQARVQQQTPHPRAPSPPEHLFDAAQGPLVVEHDHAELHYDGHTYRATMRRKLVNNGADPITRYLIRISVDRFPGRPDQSNRLYRDQPLTWEEIDLHAWWGEDRAEPMHFVPQHDRDAIKEVWLLFANDSGHFPLYPGESTWIEYTYAVGDDKWGNWFQRAVRLPTKRLSVRLDFPAELGPSVWGLHTSMTADSMPFRTAISDHHEGDRRIYSWATEDPPMNARYRLEWHFRRRPAETAARQAKPSETMRSLGVIQHDEPLLRRPARPFALPADAEDARRVVSELQAAAKRVARVHVFGKGMGIAANQIGIDRAAAMICPPAGADVITLLNPRVIESSDEVDEQYEGCLSFFDVRGMVPRPLTVHVEHQDLDGTRRITIFNQGVARLVQHEVDHLHGRFYTDRMAPDVQPIPVELYRGVGADWKY